MAKVVLHVGSHKTGTTSLQHSLTAAREELKACGISYEPATGRRKSATTAHHALARVLSEPETEESRRFLNSYRKAIADELDAGRNVLISSERFYRMKADDGLGPDGARRRYLDRAATFFTGMPVGLIVYFRRPDSYVESLFKERATKRRTATFAQCIAPSISVAYAERLQEFAAAFENVKCFCFEEAVAQGLVQHFLRRHELADRDLVDSNVRRPGVSFRGALWLVARKAMGRTSKRSEGEMWHFCLDMRHHALLQDTVTDYPWTSPAERAAYFERMVDGFPHAGFWSPPTGEITPLSEECVPFEAIDALYRDWLQSNKLRLKLRMRHKLRPFTPDPEFALGERIAVWTEERLRSLARH